LREALV
jgi:cytochrome c553